LNALLDLSEINRKIGQLFMIGMPGLSLDEDTKRLIGDYNPGGIIFFSRNISDPLQMARLCRDLQKTSIKYHGIPLFLAIDQEGGRVARLKDPFTVFPGNEAIGMDEKSVERAREFGSVTAKEMRIVGLNMNLAPVVDVRTDKPEKHLKGRIFGEDHKDVALLGETVVKALQEKGVMAVAKHFPGLGRARIDPHLNLPKIDLDASRISEIDIAPFEAAIKAGVSGVMTSHAIYSALDPKYPATLSSIILKGILRDKLGFNGLIITDDLEMGAIRKKWGVSKGAISSFRAGADILLICKNQKNFLEGLALIRGKLLREQVLTERLSQSLERIMAVKSKFINTKERILLKNVKQYFGSRIRKT
jgi:beta-N-acetylhexosaminidase